MPARKPNKKSQPRVWKYQIWLIVLLVAAAVAGLIAYGQSRTVTVSGVMADITHGVTHTYSNIAVDASPWPAQMGAQQSLRDEHYGFLVSSQSMPTIYLNMKDGSSSNLPHANSPQDAHTIIAAKMQQAGFMTDPTNSKLPFVLYGRGHTSCLEMFSGDQAVLTFTCYNRDQIAQMAHQYQPFVTAYNAANRSQPITPTGTIGPVDVKSSYGGGVIGSSRTAGYDIAEAVVTLGGTKKLVLFYNKQGGTWHFVTAANDEFGFHCKDYLADKDMRAAMYDQVCLGDDGPVKLDTSNRALQ